MRSSILLLAPALVAAKDSWGPAVSFGPSKSTIVRAVTTLQPGKAPVQPTNGFLTIWPGMSNGTGNLIQTTLESHAPGKSRCGEKQGEWCVMASVFGKPWGQLDAKKQSVVRGTDKITIDYKLESNKKTWTQLVTNANTKAELSRLSTDSEGYMRGYGTACECQRDCKGTIETHYYTDTTITFKDPEPGFKLGSSQGATFTPPQSSDGGRVWKIAKMTIPAMVKGGR